jgi:hypothetical protein
VDGRSFHITSPTRLQRISSPLAVRGTAEVYEGTLYFKVTQDRPGRDLVLGQGFVDGRASTRPGDLGQLRFRQPVGTGPGWVIFYDAGAATGGGVSPLGSRGGPMVNGGHAILCSDDADAAVGSRRL